MKTWKRGPKPEERKHLEKEPPLAADAAICVECWHDLDPSRAITMVSIAAPGGGMSQLPIVGSIPFESMVAWAHLRGLDREATRVLVDVIRELDTERAHKEAAARRSHR